MPELPEVETLKLGLQKYIVGKKIQAIEIHDPNLFEGPSEKAVETTIIGIRRLAKGVLIDLDNEYTFAIHIKLTGQLIFRDEKTKDMLVTKPTPAKVPNKFTRVTLKLSDNSFLYFQEVRGFAWMKLLKTEDLMTIPFFKNLGPDFISDGGIGPDSAKATTGKQARMTEKTFGEILVKSNLPIKVLLMEQKKIGGIGNIYANDGLFDAAIDPRRKAKTVTPEESTTLYHSLMKVLEKGMKYRGSSELNFVDALGQQGEYQKHFLIYGKKNKPCSRCGETVQKVYLGGRGTFFCTGCQK